MVIKYDNNDFARRFNSAIRTLNTGRNKDLTQTELGKLFGVSQPAAKKWLDGDAIPGREIILLMSQRLECSPEWLEYGVGTAPSWFNLELEPEAELELSASHSSQYTTINEAIYTLENAPVCEAEYTLQLGGGMLPNYPDPARFSCIPFDEDAKENAKYVVCRKPDSKSAIICMQTGPKGDRTILAQLVDGRRVDHPDYFLSYSSVEILCAIFDVASDSSLWSAD